MRNLVFIDCETTGLNEHKDHILEIGMVVVSLPKFEFVADYWSIVVPPLWPTVRRNLPERVAAMHQASNLLQAVDTAHEMGEGAPHLVEGEALAFVREHSPQTLAFHTPMAGANPDFDRRFIKAKMPKLHAAFHYRNFDVRSITQLQDWVFGVAHQDSPHRALADCRQAIEKVKEFLGC